LGLLLLLLLLLCRLVARCSCSTSCCEGWRRLAGARHLAVLPLAASQRGWVADTVAAAAGLCVEEGLSL
jgi:hypothetical protein